MFGKLVPYSPFKPGFTRHELKTVIVYKESGSSFNDFLALDTLTEPVERFHEMKFSEKPALYIFKDSLSYLGKSMTRARFLAYPNGALVISPWALREAHETKIGLNIYIRHELSHILLFQNMGVLNAYFYFPDWLLEGTAVYSAGQMGTSWYPSREATLRYINEGSFLPPECFKTSAEDKYILKVPYRITFMYSEFACIVDYIIATRGKEKFLQYVRSLCHTTSDKAVFKQIYGLEFHTFIEEFKSKAGITFTDTYRNNKALLLN